MTKQVTITTAIQELISRSVTREELGSLVVICPNGTSANAVRDLGDVLKKILTDERSNLRRTGKVLEINKFKDRVTGNRGVVVCVTKQVKQNPDKLVPKEGPLAPDYQENPSLSQGLTAFKQGTPL